LREAIWEGSGRHISDAAGEAARPDDLMNREILGA